MTEDLDLDELLGIAPFTPPPKKGKKAVLVECGQTPPAERRAYPWGNNFHTFTFDGYIAKVTRYECTCCTNLWDHLEGVFISEIHLPSGTRRLQALRKGGDWPAEGHHRKEVEDMKVPYCGHCIGDLGFDRETDAKGQPYTNPSNEVIKERRHEQ